MDALPENVLVYLIASEYDGHQKCIRLIFYEPTQNKLYDWYDIKRLHKPYCYTNLSPMDLEKIPAVTNHPSLRKLELTNKYDALRDEMIWVTKIITDDPKAIGDKKKKESLRDIIPENNPDAKVWEAKISYDCCYSYDNELEMGMPYILYQDKLIPESIPEIQRKIGDVAEKLGVIDYDINHTVEEEEEQNKQYRWISLLEYPVPDFLRCALDIEVLGGGLKVPDANKAEYPIIAVSIIGSDGNKKVLVLLRDGVEVGEENVDAKIEFYDDERDLIRATFRELAHYPFVITFNGDNFDLPYLHNRALNLGIENTPIRMSRRKIGIRNAIHIDLYRFFFNNSIKNYAFGAKYKNISLDEIATALIGEGKTKPSGDMAEWTYSQLAMYNAQDGKITLKLTTYDDGLVIKLMVILMRLATMSLDDLIRFPISQWIRGMLFCEYRKQNILIPNREDLLELKGKTSTKAMVKGKKFKGGEVVKPISGVHFDCKVMDFASLYPSIFKVKNLGYATIRCSHEECKDNIIPETDHWVCKKNKAVEAEIIGFLKDLRVFHYKKLRKGNSWYKIVEQAIKVLLNACFTPDTYVLTRDGIKNIQDFKIGDHVYSYNKSTGLIEDDEVTEVQDFNFDGDLILLNNKQMDLKVTPNHDFWIKSKYEKNRRLAKAVELNGSMIIPQHGWISRRRREKLPKLIDISKWVNIPIIKTKKTLRCSNHYNKHRIPRVYKAKDFLKFLSWYSTEGSITHYPKSNTSRISISQTKYKNEIRELLERMNLCYSYHGRSFVIHSQILANCLENLCGRYSENKKMPRWILDLNREYLEIVWKTLMRGDGDKYRKRYTTKSYQLAEFFTILSLIVGKNPTIKREDNNIYRIVWGYEWAKGTWIENHISKEKYNGKVNCITAKKNHLIFAGRNGKFTLTGQSYGVFADEKFDLYCPAVSESITAIGRNSIGKTIEKAKSLGIKVLYGDTDSVFLHKPTEEQIKELSDWSIKNLELDLEVDKVYRYVCLSSRKKNYLGVTAEGKVDVKGMTGKKKHTPWIIKGAFDVTKKYFGDAKTPEEVQALKGALKEVVRNIYFKIKRRDFDLEEIAFHYTLGKSPHSYDKTMPQHVRAAIMLEDKGIYLKKGDVISFVKIKGSWYNKYTKKVEETNVKPLQLAVKEEVDIDKYHEMLKSTFEQILDSLDVDYNSIIGITNLEQFM